MTSRQEKPVPPPLPEPKLEPETKSQDLPLARLRVDKGQSASSSSKVDPDFLQRLEEGDLAELATRDSKALLNLPDAQLAAWKEDLQFKPSVRGVLQVIVDHRAALQALLALAAAGDRDALEAWRQEHHAILAQLPYAWARAWMQQHPDTLAWWQRLQAAEEDMASLRATGIVTNMPPQEALDLVTDLMAKRNLSAVLRYLPSCAAGAVNMLFPYGKGTFRSPLGAAIQARDTTSAFILTSMYGACPFVQYRAGSPGPEASKNEVVPVLCASVVEALMDPDNHSALPLAKTLHPLHAVTWDADIETRVALLRACLQGWALFLSSKGIAPRTTVSVGNMLKRVALVNQEEQHIIAGITPLPLAALLRHDPAPHALRVWDTWLGVIEGSGASYLAQPPCFPTAPLPDQLLELVVLARQEERSHVAMFLSMQGAVAQAHGLSMSPAMHRDIVEAIFRQGGKKQRDKGQLTPLQQAGVLTFCLGWAASLKARYVNAAEGEESIHLLLKLLPKKLATKLERELGRHEHWERNRYGQRVALATFATQLDTMS